MKQIRDTEQSFNSMPFLSILSFFGADLATVNNKSSF